MSTSLQLLAIVTLGLMCGSELNVAAFAHPILSRQPLEVHIPLRSSLAKLFGQVMPFWMTGSTILNLLLLFSFAGLHGTPRQCALAAFIGQAFAVAFSLLGPVPINNRIIKWTPASIPDDWKAQEHRWDVYHAVRTCVLVAAFALLVLSFGIR